MTTPSVRTHLWTRQEYDAMVEAGVFEPGARLELLDGEVLEMPPQGSRHATAVSLMTRALSLALPQEFHVRCQLPLALDDRSEPEPDITVVRGEPRDYRDQHPTTAILVAEVADASRGLDRGAKARAYGRNGIPEYWVLDLVSRRLAVYRSPTPAGYRSSRELGEGETIIPLELSGIELRVRDLLP
jgi:Uma2 family endonuclease